MAKKEKNLVKCATCKHASLMRWFKNPVIAECAIKHDRFVAEANTICEDYVADKRIKPITQHNSYE